MEDLVAVLLGDGTDWFLCELGIASDFVEVAILITGRIRLVPVLLCIAFQAGGRLQQRTVGVNVLSCHLLERFAAASHFLVDLSLLLPLKLHRRRIRRCQALAGRFQLGRVKVKAAIAPLRFSIHHDNGGELEILGLFLGFDQFYRSHTRNLLSSVMVSITGYSANC